MSGDDGKPDPQDAIERRLMPQVLADFEQIARLSAEFERNQRRRLAAMLRNEEVPQEAERACDELRREFERLMEAVHLNGLRVAQLTAQIADLAGRLARGEVEAVTAEARMSPDDLQLLAAEVAGCDQDVVPGGAVSDNTGRILASLTPREERVLRLRFGADFKTDRSVEEVRRLFSATRERIRQIEANALRKLKKRSGQIGQSPVKPAGAPSRETGRPGAGRTEAGRPRQTDGSRKKAIAAIYESPLTMDAIVQWRECVLQGVMRLRDVIDLDAAYSAYRLRGEGNGQDDEGSDD